MSKSTNFAAFFNRPLAAVLRKHWILSLVTLLGIQATSSHAGFVTAPIYQPGGTAVAVADLNGDGIPDLAEINNDGGVSILFGNGDGTFQPAQNYDTGGVALSLAVGDLNGDGLPDLAVVNISDSGGSVGILLGAGNGTFKAAQNYTAAANPVSVAVGDFNSDGVLDLVVANAGTDPDFVGTVSIFLGNGDGSFKTPQNYLTGGPNAQSVAVADFNGDGHLDLAVTDFQFSGALIVFLGNGDGSFRLPQSYPAGQQPATVATGDFNRDGHPDIAVVTEGKVLIYLGVGDGTFQSPQSYLGGASALALGDFNGDGVLDLAVGGVGTVSILVGNGDGTFQASAIYAAQSLGIAVGDFNLDGHTDIASLDPSGVSVLLNKGDGTFGAARSFLVGSDGGLGSVAVADFNGDGKLDLATGNGKLLLGNGDGTFQAGPNLPAAGIAIVAGDLNGDKIPDLVIAMVSFNPASPSNTIAVLLGNGDGTFQAAQHYTVGQSPSAIALGDFNGDGIPDLAVADGSGVSVLLGNGNGTFQATRSTPAQTGSLYISLAVGDFNQDGKLDVVTSAGTVLLGNGDGTFQAAPNLPVSGSTLVVADLNRDGVLDLAVLGSVSGVSVLLGKGDGTFQSPVAYYAGNVDVINPGVAVGDFNQDGIPDFAVASGSSVSLLLGNGDGTFQAAQTYLAGNDPYYLGVGDFNGDGFPDLALGGGGLMTLLLNDSRWGQ